MTMLYVSYFFETVPFVEIHEGMARYPGISILVVKEFRLLYLETPSRHLTTSGVVATTSVGVVSY